MKAHATEPRLAADQHDIALALALGALSYMRHFEAAVGPTVAPPSQPLAADDPVVLASLGAIACRCTLNRWLIESTAHGQGESASESRSEALRNLLR